MLLRLLLLFVVALVIHRVLKLVFRGSALNKVRDRRRRPGLDPGKAVSAKWTEVQEDREDRHED